METEGKLLETFIENHTTEALKLVEKQPDNLIAGLMVTLPIRLSSKLLVLMDGFRAANVLKQMDPTLASTFMEEIPLSAAASILRLLDHEQQDQLLSGVSPETTNNILRLLNYPKQSVGARLNSAIFTLNQDLSVEDGLKRLKLHQLPVDTQIPVLDHNHHLVGLVGMKELIAADPEKKIRLVMNTHPPSIIADARVSESLIENQNWEGPWYKIPVVDSDGLFLGLVSKTDLSRTKLDGRSSKRQASQASVALAELYQIGLTSLFGSTD